MAIKDEIIRQNPTQGIMAQVKKKTGYSRETKDPLTVAQQERGFPTPTISGMTGFIFVNEEGRLRSPEAINRAIDTITRWCNKEEEQKAQEESREPIIIPHFSCHVFRHTFCTRFCENETNVKVIQEIMGHANISITMDIYAKATEEKKKQALDELSRNLKIF